MRVIVIILMLLIGMLDKVMRRDVVLAISAVWVLYTIYVFIKLLSMKDKKIISDKLLDTIPNDDISSSHIRYLYKKRIDNKVFISIIFELILKGSISLIRQNNEYFFIDNKIEEEVLNKSEENVKKILFKEIGNSENVTLSEIKKSSSKNSGYLYREYKLFTNTFEYEFALDKMFKPTKSIIDNSMFYFVISMIIAIYNLLYTGYVYIFLGIFIITSILVKIVNDFKNIEEEKIDEYKSWLEFKNYIDKTDISNLDIDTLENYAMYAYVLDSYDNFKMNLHKKYTIDKDSFNNSVLLSIMNASVFDYIEKEINKSINTFRFKSIVLFARNKGRRL